jgi:hypothetical protein
MTSMRTKATWTLLTAALLIIVIGCAVQTGALPGGGRFVAITLGGRTFTFAFGEAGIINTRANQPVTQAAALRLFANRPTDMPTAGRLRLLSSSVRAMAAGARQQSTPLNGTATVRISMASGTSSDLCPQATLLGEFPITIVNGAVTIAPEEVALSAPALALIPTNDVTICVQATATFDGVLTLTEFSLIFDSTSGGTGGTGGATGTVRGSVVDAQTGVALPAAGVSVAGRSTTTGPVGEFTITGVAEGAQSVVTTLFGYVDNSRPVLIVPGATTEVSIGLVALGAGGGSGVVLVLSWGEQPLDLDLHLSGPDGAGGRFHAYYNARNPVPFACLDLDDRNSFGPETMSVNAVNGTFVAGDYHVWVHNFSQQPEFDVSAATVTLNAGGRQLSQYTVGSAAGDATQDIWQVVEFTVAADGSVSNIRVRQVFAAGSASSTF